MDDLISRQAAIDALTKHEIELPIYAPRETDVFWNDAIDCCVSEIEALPSAQPDLNEWCTDCKEYDKETHHCPRFNRVIREALKDAELEIIRCKDCIYYRQEIDMCDEPHSTAHNVVQEDDYCSRAERRPDCNGRD